MSTAPKEAPRLGKYLLLKKLGGGGMGRVYLASLAGPMEFEKKVVIKTILPAYTQNKDFVQLFLNEARLGARLSHSAIAQIHELGEENGLYYLVMEYVDGWTLRQAILAAKKAQKTLNPARVAEVLARACEGLNYAHTIQDKDGKPLGVVHRDLSPQNIMISREGDVKVIDFGVARSDLSTNETVAGTIKGKLSYMAPEQARGERVDARSDIFALGVVLYESLTNRNPFDLDSPLSILRALETLDPPALKYVDAALGPFDPIVRRCLQKDKELRYPDARELRMDLLGVLERARASQRDHLGSWAQSIFEGKAVTDGAPASTGADEGAGQRTLVEAVPNPFEGPHDPGEALPDEPEPELPMEAQQTMLKPSSPPPRAVQSEQATVLKPKAPPPPPRRPPAPPTSFEVDDGEVSHVSGLRRSPPWLLIGAGAATLLLVVAAVAVKLRSARQPEAPVIEAVGNGNASDGTRAIGNGNASDGTRAIGSGNGSDGTQAVAEKAAPAAAAPARPPAPAAAPTPALAPSPAIAAVPPSPEPARSPEPALPPPPEPTKELAVEAPAPPAPEDIAPIERPRHHRHSKPAAAEGDAAPPVVLADAEGSGEGPIEGLIIRAMGGTHAEDGSGRLVSPRVTQPTSAKLTIGSLAVRLTESRAGGERMLAISSQPWAIASIDGVSRGKTPLAAVPLPSHGVRLELIRPGMDSPAVLQIRPSGQ
ncbi:MAG: serine/threonine-protein kinase [Deltaproteobacteria bacterium]